MVMEHHIGSSLISNNTPERGLSPGSKLHDMSCGEDNDIPRPSLFCRELAP